MKKAPKISVLMAVYHKDKAQWLQQAIDSILNQTVKPDEIILVIDGWIGKNLERVIATNSAKLKLVRLKQNQGLWYALNAGLKEARNELVARMDSDDIATPDRLEKQLRAFTENPDLSVVGAQIAEFMGAADNVVSYRQVPIEHDRIVKFARFRNPLNHPVVMYKKSAVLSIGGYDQLYRTEDYDLWLRLLQAGHRMHNLPDMLLYYRLSDDNMARKTNEINNKEIRKIQRRAYEGGFLNLPEYLFARLSRELFYYLPRKPKAFFYSKALRSSKNSQNA